jgi:hypothetical protein
MSAVHGPSRGDGSLTRLLGAESATGGPFALLRLTPQMCDDDAIIAALDNQLAVLAAHRECDTPEADEARLALHAAAAQLLDAKVRAYLIANWQESHPGSPQPSAIVRSSKAPIARSPAGQGQTRSRAQVALEHDAILTLGLYGGWNNRSLRRLVSLAHARGMDASQVARTVNLLAARRRGAARIDPDDNRLSNGPPSRARRATRPQGESAPKPRSFLDDPQHDDPEPQRQSPDMRVLGLALGIIAAMGLVAFVVGLMVMVLNADDGTAQSPDGTVPPTNVATAPNSNNDTTTSNSPAPKDTETNPGLITLTERATAAPVAIARATKALAIDPTDAVATFEQAVRALQGAWPLIPVDTHIAAQHEIVEFLYRSNTNEAISRRALNALAGEVARLKPGASVSQGTLWSAIWSAGMLTRLSSETDLSGTVRQRIAGELIAALRERRVVHNPNFRAGALAALDSSAESFSPEAQPPFPWSQWADAAAALSASSVAAREVLMLDALQIVLLEGGEPNDDKSTFDAIRLLAKRVPWRSGDESRRRLLAWFLDERITNADLYALTTTLARESSASGVDVTMVLPLMATNEVRQQLRGRYASAWGMTGGVDQQTIAAELADAARQAMGTLPPDALPSDYLAHTVRLSRLNEAIAWAWRGRSQEADELLAGVEDALEPDAKQARGRDTAALDKRTPEAPGSGSSWAVRYLAAKRGVPVRLDLLDQLASMPMPDAVAAELLVRDALRGTPARVRQRAQEVVQKHASDAAVANAFLEQLPTMPRTYDNALLVEAITLQVLPDVAQDDWPFEARRALVEHLLDLLSADGEYATVDALVTQLALSYVGRSSRTPIVGPDRQADASIDAAASASLLYRQWRSGLDRALANRATSISADTADRLRTGRLELASGPIQQFAANQASICEVMGIVIASEKPARTDRVRTIIDDMTNERRRAVSAFQQVFAVEQAMLRLWLIRIGEQDA